MSTTTASTPSPVEDAATAHDHPTDLQYVKIAAAPGRPHRARGRHLLHRGRRAPPLLVVMLFPMMITKFLIVTAYFMHLKYDNPLFRRVFFFGLILAAVVFLIMLTTFDFWSDDYFRYLHISVMLARRRRQRRLLALGAAPRGVGAGGRPHGALRVRGPRHRPEGGARRASRRSRGARSGGSPSGIVLLWLAADWPIHDIGEQYLYFVHMIQHLVLTLVVPPVMLLATPEWLARLVVGEGRVDAHRARAGSPGARRRWCSTASRCCRTGTVVVNGAVHERRSSTTACTPLLVTHGAAVLDPGVRAVPRAADLAARRR